MNQSADFPTPNAFIWVWGSLNLSEKRKTAQLAREGGTTFFLSLAGGISITSLDGRTANLSLQHTKGRRLNGFLGLFE